MRDKPYLETKTALTPIEKLKVAYAVLIHGWDQMEVASLMGVNLGRVNEAVMAIRKAIDPEGMKAEAAAKGNSGKKTPRRALGRGADRAPAGELPFQASTEPASLDPTQRAS